MIAKFPPMLYSFFRINELSVLTFSEHSALNTSVLIELQDEIMETYS